MIDLLVTLVALIIVAGLLYWAAMKLCAAFGVPAQVVAVIQVIFVVVVVLILISTFFPGHLGNVGVLRR